MRILHVVTLVDERSSYGGPLTVAINQCQELIRRGHDARILAGWIGDEHAPRTLEGVPAHLFKVRSAVPGVRFSGLFSLAMIRWLKRNAQSFHVAHLHTARDLVPLSAGALLQYCRVPYATQTHGMVLPERRPVARALDRLITLRILRNATARFVLTDQEDKAILSLLGDRSTNVRLPNGIPPQESIEIRQAPLDILFMGRLHPRKRVMDFAHAAQAIISDGHNVQFSIVGPDDGDLPELKAFISSQRELHQFLRYEGSIPHDRALVRLAQASIFVLPSIDEPFPMTLLEALAVGTPAICTNSCGVATELTEDGAGLVIEPGAAPLESALRKLIQDSILRASMSTAARESARIRYSMHTVGTRLLSAYQ
jgi:glycosyltransferase involved in cell wall biosynthesis